MNNEHEQILREISDCIAYFIREYSGKLSNEEIIELVKANYKGKNSYGLIKEKIEVVIEKVDINEKFTSEEIEQALKELDKEFEQDINIEFRL